MALRSTLALGAVLAAAALPVPAASAASVDLATAGNVHLIGDAGVKAGNAVAPAGDVNGDGLGDFIVGAPQAGFGLAGAAYVLFGRPQLTDVTLSNLGSGGFAIAGSGTYFLGVSVAGAGDVNGDGFDDVIVGEPQSNGAGVNGHAWVIFGSASTATVTLPTLGSRGFQIREVSGRYDGRLGTSVTGVGDWNHDGYDDVAVGAPRDYPAADSNDTTGVVYVVFGKPGTAAVVVDPTVPANPYISILGAASGDGTGQSIAGGLDVTGDGAPDLLIGALEHASDAGAAYVIRGRSGTAPIHLASLGSDGYRLDGPAGSLTGNSVALVPDVNGDGRADLAIGAPLLNGSGGRTASGGVYVVYGQTGLSNVNLAGGLGVGGYSITGRAAGDEFGSTVAGLADQNGDGHGDIATGGPYAAPSGRSQAGEVAVVFGQPLATSIDLSAAAIGTSGYLLLGAAAGERAGGALAAAGADVDGDGVADLLIGTDNTDTSGGYVQWSSLRPRISAVAATGIDTNQATAGATVSPNGTTTTAHVELGLTTAYGSVSPDATIAAAATPAAVTNLFAGLTQGTAYHYRVVARNVFGPSASPDATFTTLVPPVVPPPPPPPPPPPGPGPAPDTKAPTAKLVQPACGKLKPAKCRALRRKVASWRTLVVTATDPKGGSGVKSVQVAIVRHVSKTGCRAFNGRAFASRSCKAAPLWLNATLRRGTWRLAVKGLVAGSYTVSVRAKDAAKNLQKRPGTTSLTLT